MRFVLSILILAVVGLTLTGLYAKWRFPDEPITDALFHMLFGPPDQGAVDMANPKRTGASNDALAAPAGYLKTGIADIVTEPVSGTAAEIFKRIDESLVVQGWHIAIVQEAAEADGPMRRYIVRTKWLRFPDTLTIKLITGPEKTGIAMYSRSQIGSYDWGVNRSRIVSILASLK
jgi:uncharacterized protein (DUF1499 family)